MEKDLRKNRIDKIIKIIKANRNLPINDIKRIIKKDYPDINSQELIDILIKYSDIINDREEKDER